MVEEVGSDVSTVKPGQFVIGSFVASDNTCTICRAGYQTSCQHAQWVNGCEAEYVRVPLADGTLVAVPEQPAEELIPSLLALSDVMGTGWYAAKAAEGRPGSTVVVVGDGAVGLSGVIAAKEMGAERIIAMSRHESRQKPALGLPARPDRPRPQRPLSHGPLPPRHGRRLVAYGPREPTEMSGTTRSGAAHPSPTPGLSQE